VQGGILRERRLLVFRGSQSRECTFGSRSGIR
jgi:hypothetical protein